MVTDEGILLTHPKLNKNTFNTFGFASETDKSDYKRLFWYFKLNHVRLKFILLPTKNYKTN